MTDTPLPTSASAGIEALIERLKNEGVAEGRDTAERLIEEAEARARTIIEEAEAEARVMHDTATRDAEKTRRGGEEALRIAMRDAVLELKQGLADHFARQVEGTVSTLMRDDEMLKGMILAVAGRAREEADMDASAGLDVALPRSLVSLDDLRRKPEELREGSLSHFAGAAAAEMLRAGVEFFRSGDDRGGIRVTLKDEGVVVDLSEAAVAEVILRHLQPRFRALLENVVN